MRNVHFYQALDNGRKMCPPPPPHTHTQELFIAK